MNTEEKALRKDLGTKKKGVLVEDLVFYMKIANAAKSDLHENQIEHLSWKTLPFIPEDLGFKEHLADGAPKGDPELTIRIYHRDNIACTKGFDGRWMISMEDFKMAFHIKNKFVAFQIFSALGIKFAPEDSTVPNVTKSITEILEDGK